MSKTKLHYLRHPGNSILLVFGDRHDTRLDQFFEIVISSCPQDYFVVAFVVLQFQFRNHREIIYPFSFTQTDKLTSQDEC